MSHPSVEAMTSHDSFTPTAPLDEFIAAYDEDDNWWWRIDCGHHMNLFDAALERIEELEGKLRAREADQRQPGPDGPDYPSRVVGVVGEASHRPE